MIAISAEAVLLDIEGTTSSVRFVYDVLFPFARARVAYFLNENWTTNEVQQACEQIARDAGGQSLAQWTGRATEKKARAQVVNEVHRLMDGDVKATGLKELQGLIWREGFLSGELRAHVYEDVPPALAAWRVAGKSVCIYSSGSVTAQKLFFGHTEKGDLLALLDGHFDTTTGPKKDSTSYTAIAREMQRTIGEIVFISDIVAELDAASAAGMQTILSVRPGNATINDDNGHAAITSFDQISIQ